jgi:hypothetical protein
MTATQQIERGRVFSADEVRAFLNGKVQFREVVEPQPIYDHFCFANGTKKRQNVYFCDADGAGTGEVIYASGDHVINHCKANEKWFRCPYPVGSRIWVKETWGSGDKFYDSHEVDPPRVVAYRADLSAIHWAAEPPRPVGKIDIASWNWSCVKWRNSTQMPRWASRLLLEVVSVKVERTDKWEWVYEVKRVEVK